MILIYTSIISLMTRREINKFIKIIKYSPSEKQKHDSAWWKIKSKFLKNLNLCTQCNSY